MGLVTSFQAIASVAPMALQLFSVWDKVHWRNMLETVDQLLQGMLSLLLRCDLSTSTSLCLQHEPQKHDFRWVPLYPMLTNADPKNGLEPSSPLHLSQLQI